MMKKIISWVSMATLLVGAMPFSAMAATGVDLQISDISVNSSNQLEVHQTNAGDTDVTAGTAGHTYIYIDDMQDPAWTYSWTTLSDQTFLTAGVTSIITPQTLSTGEHTLKSCIDPNEVVSESDETNNCREETITVVEEEEVVVEETDQADLIAKDLYLDGDILSVSVENKGDADIQAGTAGSTYIYIDDMQDPAWTYSWPTLSDQSFLEAGGSAVIQPETLSEGTHTVKACVDPTNVVEEETDMNNCRRETLTVASSTEDDEDIDEDDNTSHADLVVDDLYLEGNVLSVKVQNESDTSIAAGTEGHTYIYIDDMSNPAWTYSWPTLSDQSFLEDGGFAIIQPQTLSEGVHEVKACVDPQNVVTESDEDNNCRTEKFTVNGNEGENGGDENVDENDFPEDFNADWSKYGYKHTNYLTVQWGNFNLEDDAELAAAGTIDVMSGDISFTGDMAGKVQQTLGFEEGEDQINWDETNPENISFDSTIYWGNDGLALKTKADLDSAETPMLTFGTEYSSTDVSVSLKEILDTVANGNAWTYSFDGDDNKEHDLVINAYKVDDWAKRFHSHVMIQTRIGNLDGTGSLETDPQTYTVELEVSDESVIQKYRGFILEDHELEGYDTITGDEESVTLNSALYGYQDGFVALIKLVDRGTENRSITVTVTSDETGSTVFEQTFTQEEELGMFDLNDGTGNKIEIKNYIRHQDMNEEDAETYFDELADKFQSADQDDVEDDLETIKMGNMVMADVVPGEWYEGHVQSVVDAGIFTGYKDEKGNLTGNFGPGDNVTIAQTIKVMYELSVALNIGVGALGCDPETVELTSEVDWMEGDWAAGYVQCIYNSDFEMTALGDTDEIVELRRPAMRGEVMEIAGQMLDIEAEAPEGDYTFEDVANGDLSEDVKNWTELYTEQGIISGNPDGEFKPFKFVNRAEMAKIIKGFLEVYS